MSNLNYERGFAAALIVGGITVGFSIPQGQAAAIEVGAAVLIGVTAAFAVARLASGPGQTPPIARQSAANFGARWGVMFALAFALLLVGDAIGTRRDAYAPIEVGLAVGAGWLVSFVILRIGLGRPT